jgi:hypothetical protein
VLHADFFSPALPDHSGATNGLFVTNYHPAKVIGCPQQRISRTGRRPSGGG